MMIIRITALVLVHSTLTPGTPFQDARDPVANFEYAWSRLDRNLAQFGAKHIDWDADHRVFRAQVTAATTDKELWRILVAIVRTLNDGHVCLQDGRRRECGDQPLKVDGFSRDLVKSKYLQGNALEPAGGKVMHGWLTPETGYLYIFDFKGEADPLYKAIDGAAAQFAKARALVVDEEVGFYRHECSDRLSLEPVLTWADRVIREQSGNKHIYEATTNRPDGSPRGCISEDWLKNARP